MELTMDKAGRVVIPKAVRDELRLHAGDSLELDQHGDLIQLRPLRGKAAMRKKGRFWVFRTGLKNYDVAAAVGQMREERIRELMK